MLSGVRSAAERSSRHAIPRPDAYASSNFARRSRVVEKLVARAEQDDRLGAWTEQLRRELSRMSDPSRAGCGNMATPTTTATPTEPTSSPGSGN